MPETSGTETDLVKQITQARHRLAPLSFRRFIPSETRADVSTGLSPAEIQNKCFSVLGYLEEYYRKPNHSVPEIKLEEGEGLQSLERQLDSILHPNHLNPQDSQDNTGFPSDTEAPRQNDSSHQKSIGHKLSDLLAIPQVRERFEAEFNQELPRYQASRQAMRKVRDINRVTEKLRLAIYRRYLDSKQQHGKLTQSAADQIGFFQRKLDKLELQRTGIKENASPSTLGYIETQKLLDYKKQLREKGVVLAPSRLQLIDRITREAIAGNKIFLVGSTGTGKTKLGVYVLNSLTGGYEIVNWHEGTTPRDLFGYRELWTDEEGRVQSGMKPGPIPRALERKVGTLHDEYTGGSTRTQLAQKFMQGARPGEKIQIPGFNGEMWDITHNFIEIFTGNPKDERTKQREDMDPAILRELTGVEVSYMSAQEMNDIVRAMLIEENGVLKLSKPEVDYVEKLTRAAEMMQRIHNRDFDGFSSVMKGLLGIDDQGNTEITLNANFLDSGTLFKLFGEWELAQAKGQKFADYMGVKLGEFIKDPKTLSHPEERKTLQKVLHVFGLITNSTSDVQVTIENQEKGYILPSEMAGQAVLSNENPMSATQGRRPETTTGLESQEQRAWQDILGGQIDIARLPDYVTPEVIRNLEAFGMELRFVPNLDLLPNSLRSKSAGEYLIELNGWHSNWKPYASLSNQDKADHTKIRNLQSWYWEQVKANKVNFPTLPGQWIAVETVDKPSYGNQYAQTPITARLGLSNRFKVSWNNAKEGINRIKPDLLSTLGLTGKADIRLLTALEWNLLGNREGWGKTDTYEWVEDEYRGAGGSRRLIVGNSDYGGVAGVYWNLPDLSGDDVGFRAAVVFGF